MRIAPLFFCVALLLSGLVHIDGVRADAAFQTWLQALWPQAQSLGVSRGTFDAATNGLEPDFSLPWCAARRNRQKILRVLQGMR